MRLWLLLTLARWLRVPIDIYGSFWASPKNDFNVSPIRFAYAIREELSLYFYPGSGVELPYSAADGIVSGMIYAVRTNQRVPKPQSASWAL